jgi:nicotinamide riboside transporter PnuC
MNCKTTETTFVEALGTTFGVVGAVLLAFDSTLGWWFFLISSALWLMFAYVNSYKGLMFLHCVFLITSTIGIVRSI